MRLRTIGFISTLALVLLAGPLPTEAQQAGKVFRLGFLAFGFPLSGPSPSLEAFHQRLRELGRLAVRTEPPAGT